MTDYASLKVPDLKKLLSERSLPQSGNKADLIARLQENDKSQAEDVIDWDDDDTKTAAVATEKDDTTPAPAPAPAAAKEAPAPAPAPAEPPKPAAPPAAEPPTETHATPAAAAPVEDGDAAATGATAATTTEEPAAEPSSFAHCLANTDANLELKKRLERAKRFGTTLDEDSSEKKKAERAERFGLDNTTVVKGLDEALPERRAKRGREHGDEGQRGGKRQSLGRGRPNNNKFRGGGGRRGGGGGGSDRPQKQGGGGQKSNVLADPEERAKAERRAKRFGGDN